MRNVIVECWRKNIVKGIDILNRCCLQYRDSRVFERKRNSKLGYKKQTKWKQRRANRGLTRKHSRRCTHYTGTSRLEVPSVGGATSTLITESLLISIPANRRFSKCRRNEKSVGSLRFGLSFSTVNHSLTKWKPMWITQLRTRKDQDR